MSSLNQIGKQLQQLFIWDMKADIERVKEDLQMKLPVPLFTVSEDQKRVLHVDEVAQTLIPGNVFDEEPYLKIKAVK